jgi:hypothetical protein
MNCNYLTVLGKDGLFHLADPTSKNCLCGAEIQSKKIDLSKNNDTCYDCKAILEDEEEEEYK